MSWARVLARRPERSIVFSNVDERFLPPPEHRAALTFGHPMLHYAWSRAVLNAGEELLDRTIDRVGADQVAYVDVNGDAPEEWTYGRLRAEVDRLAHGLRELGIQPGERVLTRFSDRPQAAVVQLALWKVGAIVVPSATVEAAREVAYMANDTESVAIICETDSAVEVEKALSDCSTVRAVVGWPDMIGTFEHSLGSLSAGQPETFEAHPTEPLDASGIYYTGGTTGRPKGCLHTHAAELAVADLNNAARGVTADSVLFTHAPVGHAFGNGERINFPLRAGARAILKTRPAPAEVWQLLSTWSVTTMAAAATMYRMLLQTVEDPRAAYPELPLETALSSGEILDHVTFDKWQRLLGFPVRNAVGMTPMRHLFLDSMWGGEKVAPGLSVGSPLPGYEARLIDAAGTIVTDPEMAGRLAMRGPTGITYWCNNNDTLLARAAQDVEAGWSLLDDAYLRDGDGWLWFHGRLDDMIVTGGRQVAPVEVEGVLADHPAVAEVAVVPAPDLTRGFVVAAFIRVAPGHEAGDALETELQTFTKERMAGYKYPRQIHFVDELPKDGVGKVQRRRLREQLAVDAVS